MDKNDNISPISNPKQKPAPKPIFKMQVPLDQFYTLIHSICPSPVIKIIKFDNNIEKETEIEIETEECFTLDVNAFKRGIFLGIIEPFMQMLATSYYSKRYAFYAERSMKTPSAFMHFVQVIKHVCKHNDILITSALKYEQSQSNKIYYIRFKNFKTN
jgi:hypothetical protein